MASRLFPLASSVHFVSGLWELDGNPKHHITEYFVILPTTFELLVSSSTRLTFFSGSEAMSSLVQPLLPDHWASEIRDMASFDSLGEVGLAEIKENTSRVSDYFRLLPNFAATLPLPRVIRHDKTFRKIIGQVRKSGLDVYCRMVQMGLSRVYMMETLAKEAISSGNSAEILCWIDAGFGKRLAPGLVPKDGYKIDATKINHLSSPMYFRGRKVKISGKLIATSPENWIWLASMFRRVSAVLVRKAWLIDDETVLNSILLKHPGRFALL